MKDSKGFISDFVDARKSLISEDLIGNTGFRSTRKYADLIDQFIRILFSHSGLSGKTKPTNQNRFAVAALGSYGRRELCLASDVDLIVIHEGRLSKAIKGIVSRVLYPLWDAKLEVGYSILKVQECIRLSLSDFRVFTSVIDGRFLLGSQSFYRLFEEAFWSRMQREKGILIKPFLNNHEKREENRDNEAYFVEPDIKEGPGGLRDLHFMSWMAKMYFQCKRLSQIKRFAVFSHFDTNSLNRSNSFLLKVRNNLHYVAGRKEDRIFQTYQKQLSESLGYKNGRHILAVDKFMRDIHLHLNRIHYGSEEFLTKALDIIDPLPREHSLHRLPEEFGVFKKSIVLKKGQLSEKDPHIILKAFSEANKHGLFLGSGFIWEAKRILSKIGKNIAGSHEAKKLFLEIILNPKNPKIIRLSLEIGLIPLFIPEFRKIRNLAESGFYHVKTVDLHSLKALDILNEISKGSFDKKWPLFREVFESIENSETLFMATLLHDIGKGRGGDHSEKGAKLVPNILKRLGMDGESIKIVTFLVKHHFLLSNISQRRDLDDEKTSVQVAQKIQDSELLNLLFLLSLADSFSTGPIAHSDWKVMLLIELFLKVRRVLEKGILASADATMRVEVKKKNTLDVLNSRYHKNDISNLIDQISTRYFLNTDSEDIIQHFELALGMGKKKLAWELRKFEAAPVTKIIICTYDSPGLFSKVVGVLTINDITVLSARIFTLKNGLAFDIYEVTNPRDPFLEKEKWREVFKDLELALEDNLPLDELVRKKRMMILDAKKNVGLHPKRVTITNETSDFFTVIEIASEPRLGLLYELAKRIFSLKLNIRFALFNSDEEIMTGDFYVRDLLGQKIHETEHLLDIKSAILDSL